MGIFDPKTINKIKANISQNFLEICEEEKSTEKNVTANK